MKICPVCSKELQDNFAVCPYCGANLAAAPNQAPPQRQQTYQQPVAPQPNSIPDFANMTPEQRDVYDNKAMGVLSYLGFLVFVPILAAKESRFARFHANQGFILFILEIAYWIVAAIITTILRWIFWPFYIIFSIIFSIGWLLILALAILGIVNAVQGRFKELPFIGGIFKLFKNV